MTTHSRIDLSSDTATCPTPEMRRFMAEAPVGDEQKGEDPTVNLLQEKNGAIARQRACDLSTFEYHVK